MKILVNPASTTRRTPAPPVRSRTRAGERGAPDHASGRYEAPVPELGEDAVLRIVRPRNARSIRTLMSGTSWTPNAAYVSVRNQRTIPAEAATALLAAQTDEVVTTTVRGWSEPMRVELHTAEGSWSTIVDRARQKADGRWQICEIKSHWAGFATTRALQQERLGRLAAEAIGADYVREVPASLGSRMLRANCRLIQTYRFVPVTMRSQYVAANLLDRLGTVSLGRLAEALAPHRANGRALACSMMVRRLVSIDLETPLGEESCVRAVPPLPDLMPGLFDQLIRQRSRPHDAT